MQLFVICCKNLRFYCKKCNNVYNEDENLVNILPRFVNLDKFLLLSGYVKNYALNSNIYDCKAIISSITKSFPTIKGGGGKNKGNIKLDKAYSRDELIELIKKGIDNNNE